MVFLKVCLIYKGWKVYCHLESTARQPWRVRQQLRTAALALCLLHVFKLPCLNPAFCSSRNALAALACRREAATPRPPQPLRLRPHSSGSPRPPPRPRLQAHLPAAVGFSSRSSPTLATTSHSAVLCRPPPPCPLKW